jgi:LPXTG-motif cell wall-anchored protein
VSVTEGEAGTPVADHEFVQPPNCGGLPVTGMKVGAAAAGAAGVIGVGAVLFLVARRRRIRFVAG